MDENKIDISRLSDIKKQILLLPDDILIKSINIAAALMNNKMATKRTSMDFIPEPISLEKTVVYNTDEEMAKKSKIESQRAAEEMFQEQKEEKNEDTQQLPPVPPVEKMSFLQKAKSMATAYASRGLTNNKAEEPVKSLRVLSCHGNSDLPPCPHRMNSEKFKDSYYCGACGCGDRGPTQLINVISDDGKPQYSKLDFPKVVCPLSMPGFSNYEKWKEEDQNPRKNVIESMFSVEYIMNNSNLMNEKESEENEDSSDDQTQQENS